MLKYTATLKGKINSQSILVIGQGTIVNGLTQGDYSLNMMPDNFKPQILKGLLITGYPNACHSIDNTPNIFKNKSYTYKRKLTFNNGGMLEMTANCILEADTLKSEFIVNGNVLCEESINKTEPIIEVWQPTFENNLSGLFRIVWQTESGNYLSADASSVYSPEGVTLELPILHRFIEITSEEKEGKFSLCQNSYLFHKIFNQ